MIKKVLLRPAMFLAFLFAAAPSLWACEPCVETWDFDKTAARADAIIVGQKVSEPRPDRPKWIDVRVTRSLKGSIKRGVVRVASWYGMCAYGIVVEGDKPYVMMLVRPDKTQNKPYYDAVNNGCAVKALAVKDGRVEFGGETISLEDLELRIGKRAAGG